MTTEPRRRAVIWVIPILLSLHNAEEAIAFRRYLSPGHALLPARFVALESRLTYATVVQALGFLSVGGFMLALVAAKHVQSRRLLWCMLAFQAAIGLNVLAHVVSAAFVFRGYGPGLITALTVNAPFTVFCFWRASREQWVSPTALRATVPAALFLHGPVLFGGLWVAAVLTC